jgi:anthranilate phosphoribosyltransferase
MANVAGALARIGVLRAWVLRGEDGLDEITTACATRVLEVHEGNYTEFTVSPQDFGLTVRPTDAARTGSVEENAAAVRAVLSGERRGVAYDVARDLVVLNAAAALHVRTGDGLRECAERAQRAIDNHSALHKLAGLIAMSQAACDRQQSVTRQGQEGAAR